MEERTFISFDWALKRLLRDKANFGVLEGCSEGFEKALDEGRAEGRTESFKKGWAEGFKEGWAEGFKEGRAEGERAKALEVAKKLKQLGLPANQIAETTGIPITEIELIE